MIFKKKLDAAWYPGYHFNLSNFQLLTIFAHANIDDGLWQSYWLSAQSTDPSRN